ncbi:MAG: hypothetical protein KGM15_01845 [Pseudomonadota bacterium]|nr:hypothetical protein [Pseudomonadota bacterium]
MSYKHACGAAALLVLLLGDAAARPAVAPERGVAAIGESYKLPISAPRDQGDSDLCWVFATLSMLESNYMQRHPGSHIELSRGALQRESIADRLARLIDHHSAYLQDGGVAVDALALIRADGLFAARDFHDYVDSDPIFAAASARLAAIPIASEKAKALDHALTSALGALPAVTHLDGEAVSPRALADAVLGDETWTEYDVTSDGVAHVGPSDDPDARPGTQVHYAPLSTAIDLIHRSLANGEAVVWGSKDNHALEIFGADYDAAGEPLSYWVKDSFAPYVYRAPAQAIHKVLTDVTVAAPPARAERTAADDHSPSKSSRSGEPASTSRLP